MVSSSPIERGLAKIVEKVKKTLIWGPTYIMRKKWVKTSGMYFNERANVIIDTIGTSIC